MFATGVTMLLSALYVRYRDMQPIWEVVLQMLFYASPVIYVTSTFPDSVEQEAMANPITAILTQARHALIDPAAPTAAEAIGGTARCLIPLAVVVGGVRARRLGVHARGAAHRGGAVRWSTEPVTRRRARGAPRRVAELERELAERTERANAAVAAAQDRSYWLDRLGLDLNALMRRRGAAELRAIVAHRLAAAFAAHLRGGPAVAAQAARARPDEPRGGALARR